MLNISEITLTGRLGKNPEVHTRKDGESFVTLSLANNHVKDEEPTWYQIVVNGSQAQYALENYRIGEPILVRGQMRMKKWQDKNGESRFTLQVIAGIITSLIYKEANSAADEKPASDTRHAAHDKHTFTESSSSETPKRTKETTLAKNQYRNRRAA